MGSQSGKRSQPSALPPLEVPRDRRRTGERRRLALLAVITAAAVVGAVALLAVLDITLQW